MPRRPGDPQAIVQALSPIQRLALEEARVTLNLGSRWHEAPGIASYFEMLAFSQEAERIQLEECTGISQAKAKAALRLGLSLDAVDRRIRDQRKYALCRGKFTEKIS